MPSEGGSLRSEGFVVVLGWAWLAAACGGLQMPWGPTLLQPPSEDDLSGSPEVLQSAAEGTLEPNCEAVALYLHLALRTATPEVDLALLDAIESCLPQAHPPDLQLVVAEHLEPNLDARVLGAALGLASTFLMDVPTDSAVFEALKKLAQHPAPAVRYEVVETLDEALWTADPSLVSVFLLLAEDSSPPVKSEVLRRLRFRAAGLEDPAPAREVVQRLTHDIDPGIRGRAALVLARLQPDEVSTSRMIALLKDPHAYTRSAAAEALGELRHTEAIAELAPLLDDDRPNGWSMLTWERLDGSTGRQDHQGSHFERVDDAALRALEAISSEMPEEERFTLRPISLKYLELDLVSAVREAKRWIAEHPTP